MSHRASRPRRTSYPVGREGLWMLLAALGLSCLASSWFLVNDARMATCAVTGRLSLDGQPVAGAVVSVVGPRGSLTTTDSLGAFRLPRVPLGCATILVRAGQLTTGYPIKVPRQRSHDLGSLPVYRWRPLTGVPETGREPAAGTILHLQ